MGVEIPLWTGLSRFSAKLPRQGEGRIHNPVLLVGATPVEQSPEFSLLDQATRVRNRRSPPVVVVECEDELFDEWRKV